MNGEWGKLVDRSAEVLRLQAHIHELKGILDRRHE